jgi:hypothetical protein
MAEPEAGEPFGERILSAAGRGLRRTVAAWRVLDTNQRLAATAAIALFVSLFLPWFQQTGVPNINGGVVSITLDGFEAFTFIEASALVVAGGVIALLFGRGERRPFHLPGGDGAVIAAGGAWMFLLLGIRWTFYKPVHVWADTGPSWGMGIAFAASAALVLLGLRIRVQHHPEPGVAEQATDAPAQAGAPEWALDAQRRKQRQPGTTRAAARSSGNADDPTAEQLSIPLGEQDEPGDDAPPDA